jgi:hypothetical protein
VQAKVVSGESNAVRSADAVVAAKGNRGGSVSQRIRATPRRLGPGMYIHRLRGNRGSSATAQLFQHGAASGRPEAVADDARNGAVRLTEVPRKPVNKAAQAVAEPVERSGGTKRGLASKRGRFAILSDQFNVGIAGDTGGWTHPVACRLGNVLCFRTTVADGPTAGSARLSCRLYLIGIIRCS